MKIIKAHNNQTIYDLGLQHYGSIEGAKLLIIDNKLPTGFLTNVQVDMQFKIISAPINPEVVEYYIKNKIVVVSKISNDFLIPDFLPEDF